MSKPAFGFFEGKVVHRPHLHRPLPRHALPFRVRNLL
jgi:hypothetical protein